MEQTDIYGRVGWHVAPLCLAWLPHPLTNSGASIGVAPVGNGFGLAKCSGIEPILVRHWRTGMFAP